MGVARHRGTNARLDRTRIEQRRSVAQAELRPLWIFSCQRGYRYEKCLPRLQEVLAACPSANIHLVVAGDMVEAAALALAEAAQDVAVVLAPRYDPKRWTAALTVHGRDRCVRPYYAPNGWYDVGDELLKIRGEGSELVLPPVERRDVRKDLAIAAPLSIDRAAADASRPDPSTSRPSLRKRIAAWWQDRRAARRAGNVASNREASGRPVAPIDPDNW